MVSTVSIFLLFSIGMLYGSAQAFTIFNFSHVVKLFKARDCGDWNATIRFNRFSVTPHPVIVPGSIQIAVELDIVRNISQTMTAEITVARRIDFGWFGHTWFDLTPECPAGRVCRTDLCDVISNVVDNRGCPSEIIDNGYTCACPPIAGSYSSTSDVPFLIEIRDRDLPDILFRDLIKGSYRLRFSIHDGYGESLGCIETELGLVHRTSITDSSDHA